MARNGSIAPLDRISKEADSLFGSSRQGGRIMSRRIFLTTALDRLVDEGQIGRRSDAHRIIQMVIDGGVTVLDEDQRQIYDSELIPKIEQVQILNHSRTHH